MILGHENAGCDLETFHDQHAWTSVFFDDAVGWQQLSQDEAKGTAFGLHPCGLQRSMHANVLERRFSYDTRGWLFRWPFCSRANPEMALVVESDFIHPC
jgi:hypothetical protein